MEVERVTVKVEAGGVSIEATAHLDFRESRTKEDAAEAALVLVHTLQGALQTGGGSAAALPDSSSAEEMWAGMRGHGADGGHRDQVQTAPPATAAPAGWCPMHQVKMKQQTNDRGSWYSHQTGGGWCKGK